jgi:short-subunit dehydrogenase
MKNTALITGASSGLGKEFAIIHAQRGGDLVLVARRQDKLRELEKALSDEYDCKVMVIVKDLTAANAAQEIYEELNKFGVKPEYLINNAGFGWIGKFSERKWSDESAMIALNITVLTELCHLFLPDMISKNSWKILNVSSTASLLPWPNQAVYYATKAFVTSFSNALAEELYDSKVTITALLPGATETEFWAISGMDKTSFFSKTASARDVAQDWYDGMLAWKLNIISGLTFSQKIQMKLLPFLPKKIVLKMVREGQEVK